MFVLQRREQAKKLQSPQQYTGKKTGQGKESFFVAFAND
jgi:hypothetical protein